MVKRTVIGNKSEILARQAERENWLNIIKTVADKTEAEVNVWLQSADSREILERAAKVTWANSRALIKIWSSIKNAK